jgi:hypothetical protein
LVAVRCLDGDFPEIAITRHRFDSAPGHWQDRGEPVISSVTGRQFGCLPNMIQPPLLGVVNAASAVSARPLTCRAPAVPRSCSMLSVYMALRVRPFPKLPPLEENGCGPSTLISPA